MKRTLSLVLALVMILGTFTTVFAATEAEKTAAEFLADEGILKGADGDLMLDKNLERRDAVILLSRLLGAEDVAKAFPTTEESPSFEDARTDAYYVPFIAWAEANEYFEGDDEGNFNPRNAITAQEYALVLLRALDYDVKGNEAWKAALETAEKAGLLKDVEVENKDEVVRGQMAAMTFNALGAKVNGSDETLAEKLGIKMPEAEKATELEAEVYSENLKEVIVELNNVELVEEEELLNKDNYKIVRNVIERVTLDGNNVIVELRDQLIKNGTYELVIGGIDKTLNKRHSFKALDDNAPIVEKVESLGEFGIKVTTSEPVIKVSKERYFAVDGKNIAMVMEQYGRELILTPYYSAEFPEDAKQIEISGLEDYAGFRSSVQRIDLEVIKDDVAPTVTGIELVNDTTIEVTFDKDVYKNSIKPYESRKQLGNVSYGQGRHTVYSRPELTNAEAGKYATKIETNKVRYVFEESLPRNVEITVEGVQNHSKIKMEAVTEKAVIKLDRRQPSIIDVDYTQLNSSEVEFRLYFDKEVTFSNDVTTNGKVNGTIDTRVMEDYLAVYKGSVATRNLEDADVLEFRYDDADMTNTELDINANSESKNVIYIKLGNLNINRAPAYDYDYILEVKNFSDNLYLTNNRMYVHYEDFELTSAPTQLVATGGKIIRSSSYSNVDVEFYFNKAVNRETAENVATYIFHNADGRRNDVKDLNGEIKVHNNGKTVTIMIPRAKYDAFNPTLIVIKESLKDTAGTRIAESTFDIARGGFTGLIGTAKTNLVKEINKAVAAGLTSGTAYDAALLVRDNADATLQMIEDAILALKKAVASNPATKEAYVANELEAIVDGKDAQLSTVFADLASKGTMTEQQILDKIAELVLAELKNVVVLPKAGLNGTANATIDGIAVIVKAEYQDENTVKVKITVGSTVLNAKTYNAPQKAYTLKFTSNITEGVTVVVYKGDTTTDTPVVVGNEGVNLAVGKYTYVATAPNHDTIKVTFDFKRSETRALTFKATVTE